MANAWDASPARREFMRVTEVKPVAARQTAHGFFADFGRAAFGTVRLEFAGSVPAGEVMVRLGEKLAAEGAIDAKPPGSVNFVETRLKLVPGQATYQVTIPSNEIHQLTHGVSSPSALGEITPFRYLEVGALPAGLTVARATQLWAHAAFADGAASFSSSDATLNAVWDLCQHTMKATTAFGVYIDGERERVPYEADAYINQLSHYACDMDPRVSRESIDYLAKHPTWPTEWGFHLIMMAALEYETFGSTASNAKHYDLLKTKLLQERARADGLLQAPAIVDWPGGERDGFDGKPAPENRSMIGPEVNAVVNAFYYHALGRMAVIARSLGHTEDALGFEREAARVYQAFNAAFLDREQGRYVDGEGTRHASLHANMFPLAFGLVPAEQRSAVAAFVESRGMACSVYGAQYLLEALLGAGREEAALALLTSRGQRSWWHMIEQGSTMTLEAWDVAFKPNLTWNHAWGAAPANIVSRYLLGVRPAAPGYEKILIAPQPASLQWMKGRVPTPRGPVEIHYEKKPGKGSLTVRVPAGVTGTLIVPAGWRAASDLKLDGKPVRAAEVLSLAPGAHTLRMRD